MMKWVYDKAVLEKNDVVDIGKALDFVLSYVILCYEYHLDGPRVIFTRPLRQRTLLNWSGGVHYNLSEPGSMDLLELIRTKYHLMEQNPSGFVSDAGFFLHGPICPID